VSNLNKAYVALNKCLFKNKLRAVKFTVKSSERYVLHLRLPDIVEIGGGFSEASITDILDSLLHIMVHLENHRLDVVDYTHNQYHRREFCDRALQFGLIVVWHKTRGWGITHSDASNPHVKAATKVRFPTEESVRALKSAYESIMPVYADINKIRAELNLKLRHKSTKVFQLKYVCVCCPPVIIRSGRRPDGPNPLNASCNICGEKFVIVDQVD
jgi:hypothetical protein